MTDGKNVAQKTQAICPRAHRTCPGTRRARPSARSTASHAVSGTLEVLQFTYLSISGIGKREKNPFSVTLPITITLEWIVRGARKNSYLQ